MDFNFIFDGIGSSIIGAIVGAVLTAVISIPVSFNAGKRSVIQKQKARDNANQTQIGAKYDR